MKANLSACENKKNKSTYPSKKSSNASSLIYKQISSYVNDPFNKNDHKKQARAAHLNRQLKTKNTQDEKPIPSKKNSSNQLKKKSSKIDITHYQINSIYEKLTNNFLILDNAEDKVQTENSQSMKHNKSKKSNQNIEIEAKNSIHYKNDLINSKKAKIKLEISPFISKKIEKKAFSYEYIIGKGGFGKVWKVQHIKTHTQYAMKEMLKSIVMTKKSVQSVMNERILLSQFNSPFIVNMNFAFQDRDTLFLVLDLMEGGDLRYHIGAKPFNQIQSKFFICCLILGLQDLHANKIIHRDIKPQNLVLDSKGYIRITDLGIARTYKANNSCDTSGTPGYMSPQVICRQNHSYVSDYFAVGVIAYELMTNKRPYNGRTRGQIRDCMLAKQVLLKDADVPSNWSTQSADFINNLIQRKPQNRLGFNGIYEIKQHPWLKGINWEKLRKKQIEAPFIPIMKKANFDQDEQITIQDEEQAEMIEKNALLLRKSEFQDVFKEYYFDKDEKIQNKRVISGVRKSQNELPAKMNTLYQKIPKKFSQEPSINKKTIEYELIGKHKEKITNKHLDTADTTTKQKKKSTEHHNDKNNFREFKY